MKAENAKYIHQALASMDTFLENRATVSTPFGPQNSKQGYQIKKIYASTCWIRIEIYIYDRRKRENDEHLREGDIAAFWYWIKNKLIEEILN